MTARLDGGLGATRCTTRTAKGHGKGIPLSFVSRLFNFLLEGTFYPYLGDI